ncbi:hypothetical protein DFQ27_005157 [Actinomortierella ambigua]|uniref:non-specific serine/threonine protein kinase n=1 Tax=Actinomortierella ambigua TaxID=1343610 RepID=A0A9P6Q3N4_9FUNG|nr:hypothetical protein DFQ27_005157 [Actinomortierella ambigua]
MSRLRHSHIVLFHRQAIIKERLAFIMEYAENGSLQRVIRSKIVLDWPLKEKIAQGIVRGLAYIHSEGVIHRDLKSGNVLLTKHMEPKLCDFGLATVKDFSITKAGNETLKGSIRWMAPELFVGLPYYDANTDIYALGWIMWELAAYRTPPFWEQPEDVVVIGLVKDGERLPIPDDIPVDYQQWIQRCWHQSPSERPMASEMVVKDPEPEETNEGEVALDTFSASRAALGHSLGQAQQATPPSPSKPSVPSSFTTLPASAQVAGTTVSSPLSAALKDIELDEIHDYYEKAEMDNEHALFAMAEMLMTSTGAVQDDLEALVCFFRAARKGHAEAQFRIAQTYQAGHSIPKDVDRARHWLEQAVDHGHAQAKESLRAMLGQEQPAVSHTRTEDTSHVIRAGRPPAPHTPDATDSAAQVDPAGLVVGKIIGSGSFGTVYQGRWQTRRVAIKVVHVKHDAVNSRVVRREIALLERLQHRHIIQFYGTASYNDNLVLIMDYAEGGSLQSAIVRHMLDWPTRVRIAQEIARGLAYLHHEYIIHRDLKSANVLLTRHMEVKLVDFGLADIKLLANSTDSISYQIGSIRWMAPELLSARPRYSTKSDMYALGVVMWEMAANCTTPFPDQPDTYTIAALVRHGEREELPDDTPSDYGGWIERCWQQDSTGRPEASEMILYNEDEGGSFDSILDSYSVTAGTLTDFEIDLDDNDEPTAAAPRAAILPDVEFDLSDDDDDESIAASPLAPLPDVDSDLSDDQAIAASPRALLPDDTMSSSFTTSASQVKGSAKNKISRFGRLRRWLRNNLK